MTVPSPERDSAGAADPSETKGLSEAITRLLPALEQFISYSIPGLPAVDGRYGPPRAEPAWITWNGFA